VFDVYRDWEKVYADKATPWDVGKPDRELAKLVRKGVLRPCKVLELGCGNGNDAVFLARLGFDVTAVDISEKAVQESRKRAEKSRVKVRFLVADVADLRTIKEKFDFVLDRCCFHFLPKEKRAGYFRNLRRLLKTGSYLFLVVSSKRDPVKGPYGFSKQEIIQLFGTDFNLLSMKLVTLQEHVLKPRTYICLMQRKS
jgi:SAM-dependent methyltransferase